MGAAKAFRKYQAVVGVGGLPRERLAEEAFE